MSQSRRAKGLKGQGTQPARGSQAFRSISCRVSVHPGGRETLRNTKDKSKGMAIDANIRRRTRSRGASVVVMSWLLGLVSVGVGSALTADARAEGKPNSCGCYQDASGSCFCNKKARCGCPGSCEPKGCEEKRAKEINREIEAETRKARSAGRHAARGDARHAAASDDPSPDREPAHERKAKPVHMTPAQRKELARLLELYTAEHTDRSARTVEQVRNELTSAPP